MKKPALPLTDFVTDSDSRIALQCVAEWLGREPQTTDLTAGNRNGTLLAMIDDWAELVEVYEAQRGIRKLWASALEAGATNTPQPNRWFHVAFDMRPNAPWTPDELERLLQACSDMKYGTTYTLTGLHRISFWQCFVRMTQQTRLQRTVIQEIRWEDIDLERGVCNLANHQDVGLSFSLSADTVKALERLRYPQRETVLPYQSYRNIFNTAFHRLLVKAGVDYRPGKQPRGKDRRPMRKGVTA